MCKHKSGGMTKPSGTSEGVSERTPPTSAPISSHNCPPSAPTAYQQGSPFTATTAPGPVISPFGTLATVSNQESLFSAAHQDNMATTANDQDCPFMATVPNQDSPFSAMASGLSQEGPFSAMGAVPQLSNNTCDMFRFNDNPPCDRELYQKASYERPLPDSEDETEQSPMLQKDTYPEAAVWNPGNVLGTQSFDPTVPYVLDNGQDVLGSEVFGAYGVNNRMGIESVDPRGTYTSKDNHENVLGSSELFDPYGHHQDKAATNCDNFSAYRNPRPCANHFESTIRNFDERQRMDFGEHSYGAKHKKKWLLNHKCKSADSEPDTPFNRQLASRQGLVHNYVQTHMDGCQSYVKPVYSSSNNGDPIPGPSGLQRPCSINWELGGSNQDGEFRSRSYSLTPTVNFAVFESESSSEAEDVQEPMVSEPVELAPPSCEVNVKTMDDPFELPVMSMGKVIPISPSAAQLSIASSYGDNGSPICKICHMTARDNDPLISPCRCSGTMQYIHCGCLMRWLEVCHKRGRRPASCELCQYQYHWHKKFKIRHWTFPQCSRKDKLLHLLFILSVLLMVTCASLTVVFFKQDKGGPPRTDPHQELTQAEVGNLVCGVLFFVAFFVAIYVEAKSHDTLYKLLVKFIHINQQWYIDEYEKKETPPVAV